MSNFYAETKAEVSALLSELGKLFDVRSKGVYDETTMTFGAPKTRRIYGVVADSSLATSFAGVAVDKDMQGKRVVLLDASLNPKATDEINVDGRFFSLEKIQEVKPADVVLLYILDVTL
jgi:hypothetical protein